MSAAPVVAQYNGQWVPIVNGRRIGFGWASERDAIAASAAAATVAVNAAAIHRVAS